MFLNKFYHFRYKLYNLAIESKAQLESISNLHYEGGHVDFWDSILIVGENARVMVAPQVQGRFENDLQELTVDYTIPIENIAK